MANNLHQYQIRVYEIGHKVTHVLSILADNQEEAEQKAIKTVRVRLGVSDLRLVKTGKTSKDKR